MIIVLLLILNLFIAFLIGNYIYKYYKRKYNKENEYQLMYCYQMILAMCLGFALMFIAGIVAMIYFMNYNSKLIIPIPMFDFFTSVYALFKSFYSALPIAIYFFFLGFLRFFYVLQKDINKLINQFSYEEYQQYIVHTNFKDNHKYNQANIINNQLVNNIDIIELNINNQKDQDIEKEYELVRENTN